MNNTLNTNLLIIYESFPHIGKTIEVLWGREEFSIYIQKLTYVSSDRPNQKGFPFNIIVALNELQIMHDELFPQTNYK
jgi:hypothetical protein